MQEKEDTKTLRIIWGVLTLEVAVPQRVPKELDGCVDSWGNLTLLA